MKQKAIPEERKVYKIKLAPLTRATTRRKLSGMTLIEFFERQADHWHTGVVKQKRKYTGEDYTVHTKAVAEIYKSFFPADEIGIAAAHGHDLFEDTPADEASIIKDATKEGLDIEAIVEVVGVIRDLTNVYEAKTFPTTGRAARKRAEAERLAQVDARAQNVKVADLIHNTADIVRNDKKFAKTYLAEKAFLLERLTKADHFMVEMAVSQIGSLTS